MWIKTAKPIQTVINSHGMSVVNNRFCGSGRSDVRNARAPRQSSGLVDRNSLTDLAYEDSVGQVRSTESPELAEKVGAAMADKYWSDIFVRSASHPLTLRLVLDQR